MDNNNNIQDDDDDAVVQSLLLADGWQQSPDGPKGEWISPAEVKARRAIEFGFRFGFSIFLSAQIFDFLFNPIWMHGYLWSLNQVVGFDLSDRSAGAIFERQLAFFGWPERLLYATASTAAVALVLWLCGYREQNFTIWNLLALSLACGLASGLSRTVQMKQRLYPAIHETFYVYLHFFVVGLCLTFRITKRHNNKPNTEENDSNCKLE